MSAALIAQLLAAREQWVDLAPGKAVKFRGNPKRFAVLLADVQQYAVDWRGFSEADLLGSTVGSSDQLPFSAEVWALAIGDNLDWLQEARQGLEGILADRLEARLALRGNSPAASTPAAPTAAT